MSSAHEHASHPPTGKQHVLRQVSILAVLIFALIGLHRFAVLPEAAFDPTAMLALGFVILASYTFGALVDVIRLPHITGYLLAGLLFGPSVAHLLPESTWAPFNDGVLNDGVIKQLSLLDTLAIGLIAITAGGELRIESLKNGLSNIIGLLAGQFVFVMVAITGLVVAISGVIPWAHMPGFDVAMEPAIAMGLAVAAIAFATSPAATIAVVNESGARGPVTSAVTSTVVLKDVVVVMAFAVFTVMAGKQLGVAAIQGGLLAYLSQHILLSVVVGLVLGALIKFYLRFVGKELLIFVIGVVYIATYLSAELGLDPVLVFLAAGFFASNFSKEGDLLLSSVNRLSMPVYVVFFTLAGARLHLSELIEVLPYAFALTLIRVGAIYLGARVGGAMAGAEDSIRRYGWMGFVSQAGVALTLANQIGDKFGDHGGAAIQTMIIGGIALNELIGPIMLKVGLGRAGEIRTIEDTKIPVHEERGPLGALPAWPAREGGEKIWGETLQSKSAEVDQAVRDLEDELRTVVREFARGPMKRFKRDGSEYLRTLRREFLRHHRRLMVSARTEEDLRKLTSALRSEQAELTRRWRGIVLSRGERLKKSGWSPSDIIESLDDIVTTLPQVIEAPYESFSFAPRKEDPMVAEWLRVWLRVRRFVSRFTGIDMSLRRVELRRLAKYHISGLTPPRLEAASALAISANLHLAGRSRSIFEVIVEEYDRLAGEIDSLLEPLEAGEEEETAERVNPSVLVQERLATIRQSIDAEFKFASDEVDRMSVDIVRRTAKSVAEGLRDLRDDVLIYDTLDLPPRRRRVSKVFKGRVHAISKVFEEQLPALRTNIAASYSQLAMELELLGLEAHIKETLENFVSRMTREVYRRAVLQVERVEDGLSGSLLRLEDAIGDQQTGEEMTLAIRSATEQSEKAAGDSARVANELHDELLHDAKVTPLLEALSRAATSLTARYEVNNAQMSRSETRLPARHDIVVVSFRELVSEHIETRVAPELYRVAREMAEKVQPVAASLQELERLIAFNVELATSELEVCFTEEVPVDTRDLLGEMIKSQFERSHSLIKDYGHEASGWPKWFSTGLRGAVIGVLESLRSELVVGELSRARIHSLRRSATRSKIFLHAQSLPEFFSELNERVRSAIISILGGRRIESWMRWLGIPDDPPRADFRPNDFSAPLSKAQLPIVYRRLFAADAMEAVDVLTGRDEVIERARQALAPGRGVHKAVALIGIDGVGKSAVANAVIRAVRYKQVTRINFSKPASVADVEEALKLGGDGHLMVVEDIHWTLSAKPAGFEPLRRLVQGIVEDRGRRAWMVRADALLWEYATSIAPLRDAFPTLVQLEPLSEVELQAAVMARHRLSGYGHAFDGVYAGTSGDWFSVNISRIRRPFDQYFRELHESTGGLVRDALRMWLASIRSVEHHELIRVGKLPDSGFVALRKLPTTDLLMLLQIARQGWMDVETLAHLFRTEVGDARARLARFSHLGVLEERDEGVYQIAIHLRGSVVRVIGERGWM